MPRAPRFTRKRGTYVELEGQDDVRKAFAKLNGLALVNAKAAIAESAEQIAAQARARVAVSGPDSRKAKARPGAGELRDKITVKLRDFGLTASIGTGWFVGRLLEFGTRYMPAFPWLHPSYEQERPKYLSNLKAGLASAATEANR